MMDKNTKIYIIYVAIIIILILLIFAYEYYAKPLPNYLPVVDNARVATPVINTYQYSISYSSLTNTSNFQSTGLSQNTPIILTSPTGYGTLNPYVPSNDIPSINIMGIYNAGNFDFNSNGIAMFYNISPSSTLVPMAISTSLISSQPDDITYIGGSITIPSNNVLRFSNINYIIQLQRMIISCNNISDRPIIIYFYDSSQQYREILLLTMAVGYLELDFFY